METQKIILSYEIKTWNLRNRINELPRAAFKRLKGRLSNKMVFRTFIAIIREEYETTSKENIQIICNALDCTEIELVDPDHRFRDFRTAEEVSEDLSKE